MKSKVRKLSIRYQILIPAGILALTICTLLGVNAFIRIRDGMVSMGVEQAFMAANVTLSQIDGDLLLNIREGAEDSPEYKQMLEKLRDIQELCGIAYIYTLYTDGNQNLFYGVDTDTSSKQIKPGEPADMPYEDFADTFKGTPYIEEYIDKTEYGNLISTYLPVYGSNGEIVGILGCDYNADNVVDQMNASLKSTVIISIVLFIAAIVLLNLIIGMLMRRLKKVDRKIYDLVNSEGDLTQKLDIRSGDELELIADNLNSLLEYIRNIMLQISSNSDRLNESSESVVENLVESKDGISDVSSTMEQMSAAMEETSTSLFHVDESVHSIVRTVMGIAKKASDESRSSGDTVKKVQDIYSKAETDRMDAEKQAEEMSVRVNERIERSRAVQQIEALTEEIINITDQTRLLSLNANIEAARAGEAGRGFSVVAGEIGSLAVNSAKAAEEIQKVSQEVIDAVNDLAQEAQSMIKFMNETAMSGYEMLLQNSRDYQNDVERMSGVMEAFSKESQELSHNIDNIKEAINAVNIAVEESAEGIVNVTEVSANLSRGIENINNEAAGNRDIALQLGQEVKKFKLN